MKPRRYACTKVVSWLHDPPRYEHNNGAQTSRYANIGQDSTYQGRSLFSMALVTFTSAVLTDESENPKIIKHHVILLKYK